MLAKIAIVLFFLFLGSSNAQDNKNPIDGFWTGDLPTGKDLVFVWRFKTTDMGLISGKSFVVKKDQLLEKGEILRTTLNKNRISCIFAAYRSEFQGAVDFKEGVIKGQLTVPGKQPKTVHLRLKKTHPEKTPLYEEISKSFTFFSLTKKYAPKDLQEDFEFLKNSLKTHHPVLYAFQTEEAFEARCQEALNKMVRAMDIMAFSRVILPVVTSVGCSHTRVIHPMAFMDVFMKQGKSLPLHISFVGQKAYVIKALDPQFNLPLGSEILSINQRPVSEIRKQLLGYVSAQGLNETQKMIRINNAFWMMYNYMESPESFEIQCIPFGETQEKRLRIQAKSNLELAKSMNQFMSPSRAFPLQVEFKENNGLAVLKASSFEFADFKKYLKEMEKIFLQLHEKKATHLIVDLRGNTGGQPVLARELLTYVAKKSFVYFSTQGRTGLSSDLYQTSKPKKKGFKGKAYFLMDGACLSSTGHFLSHIKDQNRGPLIGEEAGSSYTCNDNSILLQLPNTGLKLNVARAVTMTCVTGFQPPDPLLPDYEVHPNLMDLLEGKDRVLELAMELAKEG